MSVLELLVEVTMNGSIPACRVVDTEKQYPAGTPYVRMTLASYPAHFDLAFPGMSYEALQQLMIVMDAKRTIDRAVGLALEEFVNNDFQPIEPK